ncbi:MAG: hypothetical protein BWY79_01724 [Actinobacteria bacterium ADurb.Bin444]|nr:MAG: hypothetical protein BWY79_01724 [Actinobacteria bacterium ADurb.Bin444]
MAPICPVAPPVDPLAAVVSGVTRVLEVPGAEAGVVDEVTPAEEAAVVSVTVGEPLPHPPAISNNPMANSATIRTRNPPCLFSPSFRIIPPISLNNPKSRESPRPMATIRHVQIRDNIQHVIEPATHRQRSALSNTPAPPEAIIMAQWVGQPEVNHGGRGGTDAFRGCENSSDPRRRGSQSRDGGVGSRHRDVNHVPHRSGRGVLGELPNRRNPFRLHALG